jgi:succinate dehydrogenase/fumarate reductase flavoprotein subunit
MERYAPSKMELAPRDMVSRAETTEILEGRGFPGPEGKDYLHLDLTHLGADVINTRLPLIREVCIKFAGIDPIKHPDPAGCALLHGWYERTSMVACLPGVWPRARRRVSLHGANRLERTDGRCPVWEALPAPRSLPRPACRLRSDSAAQPANDRTTCGTC